MNIPGYQRIEYLHRFDNALRGARLSRLWKRLLGKPETLLPFAPIHARVKQRMGYQRGVREIPLRQIVGSIDKAPYFDRDFRPLSNRLRNRWVNIKALQITSGWEPIVVHQIGNLYFVEDGHHRVSVAREERLEVIEARVTEYPVAVQFDRNDGLQTIIRRLDAARVAEFGAPGGRAAVSPGG